MRSLLTIILLFVCCCCEGVSLQQKLTVSPSPTVSLPPINSAAPEGWALYPQPAPDSPALYCANASRQEWRVGLDGDKVTTRLDTLGDSQAALPAAIIEKSVQVGSKGQRYIEQVNDGWLVGLDIGEFGGGLWWFSLDGKTNKKLATDNIQGFAKTSAGVLALSGLAHLTLDRGKILKIGDGTEGSRSVTTLADLGSAPQTFAVESADALLVLTTRGLVRVRVSGTAENLHSTKYNLLYPTSMTLSPTGVIYIGMRHFITRLTPAGDRYKEEWFVPTGCQKFTQRDFECVCTSR